MYFVTLTSRNGEKLRINFSLVKFYYQKDGITYIVFSEQENFPVLESLEQIDHLIHYE